MGAKNTKGKFGLEKDVLDLVKQTKFSEEKVKQMQEAFLTESDDLINGMSRESFVSKFTSTFFPSNRTSFAQQLALQIFQALDTDSNDCLSFKEFVLGLNVTANGSREDQLRWTFKLYDASGDGVLEQQEVLLIMQSIQGAFSREETGISRSTRQAALSLFNSWDVKNSGKVTEDQFVEAIMQQEGLTPKCQQSNKEGILRMSRGISIMQQLRDSVSRSSPLRQRSTNLLPTSHG